MKRSLNGWLTYIGSISDKAMDLGLSRVKSAGAILDVLKLPSRVITVTGTNGKGSTTWYLGAVLERLGYTVDIYNSPHLLRFNERILIRGHEVADDVLTDAFEKTDEAMRKADVALTFFEFTTLAALLIFKNDAPDFVILEIGLGGRLDATNAVDSDAGIVVSIGLDHTGILGNTVEDIAYEKSCIYRKNHPAVCSQENPPKTLLENSAVIGAKLLVAGRNFRCGSSGGDPDVTEQLLDAAGGGSDEGTWFFRMEDTDFEDLPLPSFPYMNAAGALACLSAMGIRVTRDAAAEACRSVRLPGRLEVYSEKPRIIFDVSHNPPAVMRLRKHLEKLSAREHFTRVLAVCGMLHDKDYGTVLREMDDLIDVWYLADLTGPRAAKASDLAPELPESSETHLFRDPATAWCAARAAQGESDLLVVFGSFLTVAAVREFLESEESKR
ncbi:MAG: bifunctional tetrahydrofolate synthase/dihydrofolate synthase [Succinivibrionaceae bacterium]|nr:bifunctional tetrahydrofolate synthase/dihydrofolate synthase [Pseudomonadota bacterium]MDY6274691.1 bifunctional tetrahydrofolate synthase/dihydrofolate synthase [Succinivibrionaceae bacterium]MDY6335532.1 bifunctional tetrahydrofolate synthase/dihydrofolate synthase [Succinivibrionaceae bacterium]MDY6374702.1 bifunctional tetrahydrofolate synthase/dihydrofolate synthase [Succinivibrionaceae bacterium]